MKRILTAMCALALVVAGAIPAFAAQAAEPDRASYYPIEVEEYMEGDSPRIRKVYQLSISDDPSAIPTEDFERDGRLYYLLDMTRKDELGVDIRTCTQTVTLASDTDDMEQILKELGAQIETTTEDGYTGTLFLDHTTVKVTTDGYATRTQNISATRTYPNLSDADVSLIPKSIEDRGRTLTLNDVDWSSSTQAGADGIVEHFTATASYTGTVSSSYATGYTVTADYTGEVARTDCSVVTYTAVFGSIDTSENKTIDIATDAEETSLSIGALKTPLMIGAVVLAASIGGFALFRKFRGRR